MSTVIARTVTRTVVPLILVTALALLLQGHNLPGGGFIGGVLTVTAFALIYIIYGLDYLEEELLHQNREPLLESVEHGIVENYQLAFGVGLGVAAVAGLVPLLFGHNFLYQTFWVFHHLPVYGEFEVASALAFDLGVYFVVVGALLTILAVVGTE
ncbi:MnhB domain-containing protein [Halorussus sp. MSC15.2]|uniref:MnhB domain-containing protein n=1 Tax=Halorussus sp. MSC15.2 TaxID=2283638 RepID=UPI0013D630BE|nr:MnhB domain-containing protein [Halorussus sp. MSC15.2]NEU59273.1 sodium:proton antiporter [Halorussus sp. MSC15.2]